MGKSKKQVPQKGKGVGQGAGSPTHQKPKGTEGRDNILGSATDLNDREKMFRNE